MRGVEGREHGFNLDCTGILREDFLQHEGGIRKLHEEEDLLAEAS